MIYLAGMQNFRTFALANIGKNAETVPDNCWILLRWHATFVGRRATQARRQVPQPAYRAESCNAQPQYPLCAEHGPHDAQGESAQGKGKGIVGPSNKDLTSISE